MSFEILIAHDGHQERRALSVPGSITIGRDADCTISLNSALVSRRHVSLAITGSVMRVQDSSRNGTLAGTFFLNNSAREVPLDTPLTVGEYTLSVLSRTQPAPPAEPVPEAPRLGAAAPELAGQENAREHALELAAEEQQRAAISLRRDIHRLLLEHLDLATVQASKLDDPSLRPKVLTALRRIVQALEHRVPAEVNRDALVGEMADEALGLGPLENLLSDPTVNEIMVVDP